MSQTPDRTATSAASTQNSNAIARSSMRLRPLALPADHARRSPEAPTAPTPITHVDFARHREDVVRYLSWLRVPKFALDELVQEVFLVAHRRHEEFRGESSLKTWLRGIAFHLVLNWRRRQKWRDYWEQSNNSSPAQLGAEEFITKRDAMDELLTKELCSSVSEVLKRQPEVAQHLWLMVVLEEVALSRAAKSLGLSDHQAQQSFAKTQQRVQQALTRRNYIRVETAGA